MVKYGFDCIFYYSSDLAKAKDFYSNMLGLTPTVENNIFLRFEIDGVMFEVVHTASQDKVAGGGNARLCLQVADMQEALIDLKQKGIPTTPIHKPEGGLLVSIFDTDGNEICIWQYV